MICPHCGVSAPDNARFCPACGRAPSAPRVTPPPAPPQPTREKLLIAAIGPDASSYLEGFMAREQGHKGSLGWHWPAFFVTFCWLLYRKMYGLAFAYLGIAIVLAQIVAPILAATLDTVGALLALLIYLGLFIVPALFAGALYHRRCRQVIAFTQRYQPDPQRQLEQIRLSGGTSAAGYVVPIVLLAGSVPIIGILAAIALPAYQDYTVRAASSSAYAQMRSASRSVSSYYIDHDRLPLSLEEAGYVAQDAPGASELSFDRDGVIHARLPQKGKGGDKTLRLAPAVSAEGLLVWTCSSDDIPDRQLPTDCRSDKN